MLLCGHWDHWCHDRDVMAAGAVPRTTTVQQCGGNIKIAVPRTTTVQQCGGNIKILVHLAMGVQHQARPSFEALRSAVLRSKAVRSTCKNILCHCVCHDAGNGGLRACAPHAHLEIQLITPHNDLKTTAHAQTKHIVSFLFGKICPLR